MLPNEKLFRENALNQLNNIEDLNTTLTITPISVWLIVGILIVLVTVLLIWLFFGVVILSIEANGIVIPDTQIALASIRMADNLAEYKQNVFTLKKLYLSKKQLYRKHYLTILEVLTANEKFLLAAEEYQQLKINSAINFSIKPEGKLNILIFLNYVDANKIAPFMKTYSLPIKQFGYTNSAFVGRLLNISDKPISKINAAKFIENANLVDEFFIHGVPYLGRVRLKDSKGLKNGAIVTTKIIYKKCKPITFLIRNNC